LYFNFKYLPGVLSQLLVFSTLTVHI